jgi:hypothetical protein
LKVTQDYAIDPMGGTPIMMGVAFHESMNRLAQSLNAKSEVPLRALGIQGTCDLIEEDTLTDYKTYGSYRVKRLLYDNDNYEPAMQLNIYRRLLKEQDKDVIITALRLFCIVRDAGTAAAKNNGIDKEIYTIELPIFRDSLVEDFITQKRDNLLEALRDGKLPPKCTNDECWQGRKCFGYCPVSGFCRAFDRGNDDGVSVSAKQ